jgi:GT2 family glycosyltransferase
MRKLPDLTSVIPTRNRASHLQKLLDCLASQSLAPDRHEVTVVVDGPDEASTRVARDFHNRLQLRLIEAPRLGIAHAKNEALAAAAGRIIVLLNDDVRPAHRFLENHAAAHRQRRTDTPAMVLGYSPFIAPPPAEDTLFDRLIRESSMIFFYDRMIDASGRPAAPPDHDWGFRHAWNMNLSLPRDAALDIGGFVPAIANCCYEDIEFAWRLHQRHGSPVHFNPAAFAPHDHRYSPDAYLERERRLGYSAPAFADASPRCAREVFARDLLAPAERAGARAAITRESAAEPALLASFRALARQSAASLDRPRLAALVDSHRPLKRLAFHRGFVESLENKRIEGLFHPSDRLPGTPPLGRPVAA